MDETGDFYRSELRALRKAIFLTILRFPGCLLLNQVFRLFVVCPNFTEAAVCDRRTTLIARRSLDPCHDETRNFLQEETEGTEKGFYCTVPLFSVSSC